MYKVCGAVGSSCITNLLYISTVVYITICDCSSFFGNMLTEKLVQWYMHGKAYLPVMSSI